jgi:hypothetical protein
LLAAEFIQSVKGINPMIGNLHTKDANLYCIHKHDLLINGTP